MKNKQSLDAFCGCAFMVLVFVGLAVFLTVGIATQCWVCGVLLWFGIGVVGTGILFVINLPQLPVQPIVQQPVQMSVEEAEELCARFVHSALLRRPGSRNRWEQPSPRMERHAAYRYQEMHKQIINALTHSHIRKP